MPNIPFSTYIPPRFLNNGHLQTLYAALFRRIQGISYQRQRLSTPDGDFLDLDWSLAAQSLQGRKQSDTLVILCHGLEGQSSQPYIMGMAKMANAQGWDALAWNYRGCSGETNRTIRFYHSGATEDLELVISHVLDRPYKTIFLIGFSLGGNLILKYLGEKFKKKEGLPRPLKRAVAISVPCCLESASRKLSQLSNRIYMESFLFSLRKKILLKKDLLEAHGHDLKGLYGIRDFKTFDDRYTAPLHGLKDAQDYWDTCSGRSFLPFIQVPTLILNAEDDPFLGKPCYPREEARKNPFLFLEIPPSGGHVGFVSLNSANEYWSESRSREFLLGN